MSHFSTCPFTETETVAMSVGKPARQQSLRTIDLVVSAPVVLVVESAFTVHMTKFALVAPLVFYCLHNCRVL